MYTCQMLLFSEVFSSCQLKPPMLLFHDDLCDGDQDRMMVLCSGDRRSGGRYQVRRLKSDVSETYSGIRISPVMSSYPFKILWYRFEDRDDFCSGVLREYRTDCYEGPRSLSSAVLSTEWDYHAVTPRMKKKRSLRANERFDGDLPLSRWMTILLYLY